MWPTLPVLVAACSAVVAPTGAVPAESAATGDGPTAETAAEEPPAPDRTYAEVIADIEVERQALAEQWALAPDDGKPAILAQAAEYAARAVSEELIPFWYGTRWDFNGTSEVPGEGTIACGYFVTTVLRDAGVRVERAWLAQQASEHIILSLTPADDVHRYRLARTAAFADSVVAMGDGLYLVGLDYHVGFLGVRGTEIRICHASYIGESGVVCEDARTAPAIRSRYRVVGRLFEAPMTEAWLADEAIPTYWD